MGRGIPSVSESQDKRVYSAGSNQHGLLLFPPVLEIESRSDVDTVK